MEKVLTKFFTKYNNCLNDKHRFIGLLKDIMPGKFMQINLLINLYEIGIHKEIEAEPSITNTFAFRFVSKMCDEFGVNRMNADWAVAAWCICYGKNTLNKACELSGFTSTPNKIDNPIIKEESRGKKLYQDCFRFEQNFNGKYSVVDFVDKSQRTLVVPSDYLGQAVTAIATNAFNKMEIEEAVIIEGINEIGVGAFSNCVNLRRVLLPDSLTVIANNAFAGCLELSHVLLPHSLQRIGENAFAGCQTLKEVIIPKSIIAIGLNAFDKSTTLMVTKGSYAEKYARENIVKFKYDKSEDFPYGLIF